VGRIFVSAEIIRFILRRKHDREETDFPTIAFKSAARDDLVMDHANPAACECVHRHREEQSGEAIQ
jgi:hypothetical protein